MEGRWEAELAPLNGRWQGHVVIACRESSTIPWITGAFQSETAAIRSTFIHSSLKRIDLIKFLLNNLRFIVEQQNNGFSVLERYVDQQSVSLYFWNV